MTPIFKRLKDIWGLESIIYICKILLKKDGENNSVFRMIDSKEMIFLSFIIVTVLFSNIPFWINRIHTGPCTNFLFLLQQITTKWLITAQIYYSAVLWFRSTKSVLVDEHQGVGSAVVFFGDSRGGFFLSFLASTRYLHSLAHGPTSIQSLLPLSHLPFSLCFCHHITSSESILCDWTLQHFDTLETLSKG